MATTRIKRVSAGSPAKGGNQATDPTLDPSYQSQTQAAITSGQEQAPTVSTQSGSFVDWQGVRDQLGSPFDISRTPPLRKLMQMRRDPMIAFALHYIKVSHVRARWSMDARDKDGPNAQVAAFMDAAWRQIHARYVLQRMLSLDFGFSAMVKRFQNVNPGGTWIDQSETDPLKQEKPVWDEGNVLPWTWKTFVALDPARVQPDFDENTGEFAGITYTPPSSASGGGIPSRTRRQSSARGNTGGGGNTMDIDVFHSLWATNDRESVFGSLYGYPRIAHAYYYWWSWVYRWAMSDRAYERQAIPPILARHPEGMFTDPEDPSATRPYNEIALEAAEALRSNAIAAVPSTLASSAFDDKSTSQYAWSFEYMDTKLDNLAHFESTFNAIDVMKLRAVWVPEQAFIEGEGGTSSRNVATAMAAIFEASQGLLWDEMADEINRFILPQLLIVNFPEFVNNGGTCKILAHGFDQQDIELQKQVIQLIGQSAPEKLSMIDFRTMFEQAGMPVLSHTEFAQLQQQQATAAAAQGPPAVNGGTSGVSTTLVPAQVNQGQQNGGSAPGGPTQTSSTVTGFGDDDYRMVYVQPKEVVFLSADAEFLAGLPNTKHYTDKQIRTYAAALRKSWSGHLRAIYPDFADFLAQQKLELADQPQDPNAVPEPSTSTTTKVITVAAATKVANDLLKAWKPDGERLRQMMEASANLIGKSVKRAISLEAVNAPVDDSKVDEDKLTSWVADKANALMQSTTGTITDELRDFVIGGLREGKDAQQISADIKGHFDDFPGWKSVGVARDQIRDAVNAGTLFVGEANEIKYVQAHDGTEHDAKCRARNGKLFPIKRAWNEMSWENTHPNDTLSFTLVPNAQFSVSNVAAMPENVPDGAGFYFDESTTTAFVLASVPDEQAEAALSELATVLIERGKEAVVS
jgi:hypothetical protein